MTGGGCRGSRGPSHQGAAVTEVRGPLPGTQRHKPDRATEVPLNGTDHRLLISSCSQLGDDLLLRKMRTQARIGDRPRCGRPADDA